MARDPYRHRRLSRIRLGLHHGRLRQAALLLDLQDVLQAGPGGGNEREWGRQAGDGPGGAAPSAGTTR